METLFSIVESMVGEGVWVSEPVLQGFMSLLIIPLVKALWNGIKKYAMSKFSEETVSFMGNAQKYTLLGKVEKESIKEYWIRLVGLLGEFLIIIVYYIILLLFLCVFSVSIELWLLIDNTTIIAWGCIALVGILIYIFIKIKKEKKAIRVCVMLATIIFIGTMSGIYLTVIVKNTKYISGAAVLLTLLLTGVVIYIWHKKVTYRYYKYPIYNIIRIMRYAILPCAVLNSIINDTVGWGSVLINLWMGLWVIEYIGNLFFAGDDGAEVVIHTSAGEVKTNKKIVYYKSGKIKYTLLDGTVKLVNVDDVQAIDYNIRSYLRPREKVELINYNGECISYDGYAILSDVWVVFYNVRNRVRETKILKLKDIKEVIVEKKTQN